MGRNPIRGTFRALFSGHGRGHRQNGEHGNTRVTATGGGMGGITFSAVQTSAKAGAGERYLSKRVLLAAKIETSKEVSPR